MRTGGVCSQYVKADTVNTISGTSVTCTPLTTETLANLNMTTCPQYDNLPNLHFNSFGAAVSPTWQHVITLRVVNIDLDIFFSFPYLCPAFVNQWDMFMSRCNREKSSNSSWILKISKVLTKIPEVEFRTSFLIIA